MLKEKIVLDLNEKKKKKSPSYELSDMQNRIALMKQKLGIPHSEANEGIEEYKFASLKSRIQNLAKNKDS